MKMVKKVILVGDVNVGKTSLFVRFRDGSFVPRINSTIGLDQIKQKFTLDNGHEEEVNLWDTGNQEVCGYLTSTYYRYSNCMILMYDVTNKDSLDATVSWLENAKNTLPKAASVFLLGNKTDCLHTERAVTLIDARNKATQRLNIPENHVFEISVKAASDLEFESFFKNIVEIAVSNNDKVDAPKQLPIEPEKRGSSCC